MHQPAHQLGDVIVNIGRTYTPDRRTDSIDHSNNNYEATDLLGFRGWRRKKAAGRRGGDKSTIRDENDQVPRAHKAKERSERKRETK